MPYTSDYGIIDCGKRLRLFEQNQCASGYDVVTYLLSLDIRFNRTRTLYDLFSSRQGKVSSAQLFAAVESNQKK